MPEGLTTISDYAFCGCSSLEPRLCHPPRQPHLHRQPRLWGCSALSSVTLPAGLSSIGGYAFASCSALGSVTFPAQSPSQPEY